jgi:hypothetical protein
MTAQKDDLEAVRAVAAALEEFDPSDQERILRWAREKLGLPAGAVVPPSSNPPSGQLPLSPSGSPAPLATSSSAKDLKTFYAEKKPKSDVQFAATVAYFHRFEAPPDQRKNEINSDDLVEGSRLVNRPRLHKPGQTLLNAHKLGLLDRVSRGAFTINSVGENLVAMTLPGEGATGAPAKARKTKKQAPKKTTAKTAKK